jgi:TolA-binding protein
MKSFLAVTRLASVKLADAIKETAAMRIIFALLIVIACIRLSFILTTISSGPPISQAQEQTSSGVAKTGDEPRLDAMEGVINAPPGSPHDPDRQFFNRIMVEVAHHDYEAAAAGFRLFVELHPTSSLSAQADYWLGECEYQLGHYQEAIAALDHALSRTPFNPPLAAAAFLRKGNSYARLGDIRHSRSLLELIVVQFPATEEAAKARQTLLLP